MSAKGPTSDPSSGLFNTTHWSVVLAAQAGDSLEAAAALEKLCGDYRQPLLHCIQRRMGCSLTDAENLVQCFIYKFLKPNVLGLVHESDDESRKFRYFLLHKLGQFLLDEIK